MSSMSVWRDFWGDEVPAGMFGEGLAPAILLNG